MSKTVDETLEGREGTYGVYSEHAKIAQALKGQMRFLDNWERLDDDMREALEMIQHKVARILNGDPKYADNWHDIAGYARIVEIRLNQEQMRVEDLARLTPREEIGSSAILKSDIADDLARREREAQRMQAGIKAAVNDTLDDGTAAGLFTPHAGIALL